MTVIRHIGFCMALWTPSSPCACRCGKSQNNLNLHDFSRNQINFKVQILIAISLMQQKNSITDLPKILCIVRVSLSHAPSFINDLIAIASLVGYGCFSAL
jgi:hypothetical protein